ncbi:hypothetical protein OTU49_015851, partial [Cherax quadricarinatus]
SKQGLHAELQLFLRQLEASGLEINPQKCATLNLQMVPRMKKWYVDTTHKMEIYRAQVHSLQTTTVYKYFGMHLSSAGRGKPDIQKLRKKLVELDEVPLKPQQ